jgi:hypothetical protein
MEEGGQALELDLRQVQRQDSCRIMHTLDHEAAQVQIGLPRAGGLVGLGVHLCMRRSAGS